MDFFSVFFYYREKKYRTNGIITPGLYLYYQIFEDHYFCFQGVTFRKLLSLLFNSGLWSKEDFDGLRRVVILNFSQKCHYHENEVFGPFSFWKNYYYPQFIFEVIYHSSLEKTLFMNAP